MSRSISLLQNVSIASPCAARWDDMAGDDAVRFCGRCRMNVYNLSAMTARQAEDLLRSADGRLCTRLFRRADGTVMTRDCPVGLARVRRAARRTLARIGAIVAIAIGGLVAARPVPARDGVGGSIGDMPGLRQVRRWLGPAPVPTGRWTMGEVYVAPGPTSRQPGCPSDSGPTQARPATQES